MGNRRSEPLKRRAVSIRSYVITPLAFFAALAPLLLTGCTSMVSGENKSGKSAVQVAPAAVDFGSTGVGNKVSRSASVTNNGKTTVILTKASISSTEFSISGLQFPLLILPGQKTNFTVWFKGTKAGKAKGTLNINGDTASPDPVVLTGTAASSAPQLEISTSSHDFGKVTVNTVATATLALTNSGASNLTISTISVTGAAFEATGVKLPAIIPVGGNVPLDITFSPKTDGNYSGNVIVSSDDPDSPTKKVDLAGIGTTLAVGKLTATPAILSFSNVKVGSAASAVTTLRNTGTSNVTLSKISLSAAGFSTSGIVTPVLIVPGESLALNVKFNPTSAGTGNGNISLVNSQGAITTVSVSGTAVQSGLSVSPGSISFGNVVTGLTNTQTVLIANPSAVSVTITTANITGAGFSASGLNLPLTLNAGQSSTFNVQFNPNTAATSTGSLTLVSNASNTPSAIALTGTGIAAGLNLSVSPSNLSFGNITVGNIASRSITVTNTGNSNVAISNVNLTGAKFLLTGGSAVTLSPSQSITLTAQFAPTAVGPASGSILIVSNASISPAAIPLTGTGVAQAQHTVELSWNASTASSKYNVYRSVTSGGGYLKLNSSPESALSYGDSTVQNSQTYFYVTTAVDGAGNESAFSSEVSVNIP